MVVDAGLGGDTVVYDVCVGCVYWLCGAYEVRNAVAQGGAEGFAEYSVEGREET